MQEKDQKAAARRGFFKGFAGTLAVLLPVYACVFYLHTQTLAQRAAESAAPPAETVPVETARSVNLLCLLEQEQTGRLFSVLLLRLDAENGRTVCAVLPAATVVLEAGLPRTLAEVHAQKGVLATCTATKETLGVPLEGYVCLDENTLDALMARFDPVPFTLDAPVQVLNAEGLVIYSKAAGSGYLSGNDVAHLLLYGGYDNAALAALQERMASACLTAFAGKSFPDRLANAYAAFVDRMDTDLSTADIYLVGRAAAAAAGEGSTVHIHRIAGSFNAAGNYELAQGSDTALQVVFGRC